MILYSNGDSVTWGAELENKKEERFSKLIANHYNAIDCNNSSAGVSNDYIFRQTIRDIIYWKNTKKCWSEESGWIEDDNIIVMIGWTSPTRFEWWNGHEYQQERLWEGYDKWGSNDEDRTTEDIFVKNQTELIPSYIKTFNQIISLSSILKNFNIPFCFFNVFYEYEDIKEPINKIDTFGRDLNQLSIDKLKNEISNYFFDLSMYAYLKNNNGTFLPRKHPSKESHKLWADYIIKQWL
jgi:hypothetical protein